MKTEIFEFLGGAISFLYGGARVESKFSPENSRFFISKLQQNNSRLKNRNFRWKLNHSFDGDPLNGSQILKNFSKIFLGSLKFLGFSSSLIFGPLEKYKVGEAYR